MCLGIITSNICSVAQVLRCLVMILKRCFRASKKSKGTGFLPSFSTKKTSSACASLLKEVCAIQRSKTICWSTGFGSFFKDPKGPPPRSAIQAPKRATRASALVSSRYSLAGPPYFLGSAEKTRETFQRGRCEFEGSDWISK